MLGATAGLAYRFIPGLGQPQQSGASAEFAPGKRPLLDRGRTEVNRGGKAVFGEFIHWQLYLDSFSLAGRPVPQRLPTLLTSF